MGLRVGQVQRFCRQRDRTDKTFTQLQACHMDRIGVQALRCKKLKDITGALNIDRTHFGGHFGGNDLDDFVEPVLCRS